jgi:phage gp46-like protein
MADIRLIQYDQFPLAFSIDYLLLNNGTLDQSLALSTAVILALGTDRLALPSDILPDPDSTDRAGWWGDLDAQEIWNGWPIGCRLWLMRRSKITGSAARQGATVTLVEQYCREALQPFVDLKIVSSILVKAQRIGLERVDCLVRLYRASEIAVDLRYSVLWDELPFSVPPNRYAVPTPMDDATSRRLLGRP